MTLDFPNRDDLGAAETAAETFIWRESPGVKLQMLKTLRAILDRYGVKRLRFPAFDVVWTKRGARIEAKLEVTGKQCPTCGSNIYDDYGPVHLVQVAAFCGGDDAGWCTYRCERCKTLFKRWEGSA